MKKGIALLLAAGSAVAFTVPAAAQDDPDFTGPRVEALVGYDSVRPGSTVDIDNADEVDQSIDDVTYGFGLGYDFDMGSAVIGVEGEYMRSEAKTDFDTTGFTTYGISNIDAGRDLYIGARAGLKVTPRTLGYVKAGYTNARVRVDYEDGTAGTVADFTDRTNLDGVRAGLGAQIGLGPNAYLKTEYRYSNYQDGVDRHQVVGGLGFRF